MVLGCPGRRDGSVTAMQRWRVDTAVAARRPETRFVFTGYRGEADQMAADALARHRVDPDRVTRESASTTTWENIELSAALIPVGSRVRIASDRWHAARARGYWRQQFPDRSDELGQPLPTRWWRHPLLAAATTVYEGVLRLGRYRPDGRGDRWSRWRGEH